MHSGVTRVDAASRWSWRGSLRAGRPTAKSRVRAGWTDGVDSGADGRGAMVAAPIHGSVCGGGGSGSGVHKLSGAAWRSPGGIATPPPLAGRSCGRIAASARPVERLRVAYVSPWLDGGSSGPACRQSALPRQRVVPSCRKVRGRDPLGGLESRTVVVSCRPSAPRDSSATRRRFLAPRRSPTLYMQSLMALIVMRRRNRAHAHKRFSSISTSSPAPSGPVHQSLPEIGCVIRPLHRAIRRLIRQDSSPSPIRLGSPSCPGQTTVLP